MSSQQPVEKEDLDNTTPREKIADPENLPAEDSPSKKESAFKSLGLLDRFLAVWILLAMIIGVLLGNFVPQTGPTLQKGKFVGVSIPIGIFAPRGISIAFFHAVD
jgi:arsenite transporter